MATEHKYAQVLRWIADGKTVQSNPGNWRDTPADNVLELISSGHYAPEFFRLKPEPVLQCTVIQTRGLVMQAQDTTGNLHRKALAAHTGAPAVFESVCNITPFPGGSVVELSGPGWSAIVTVLEVQDA